MKNKLFPVALLLLSVASSLAAPPLCAGILPQDGEAQYELEFWQSIQDSTDAGDYEAYLEAYPDGRFAPLARTRAARYRKQAPRAEPAVNDMDIYYQAVTDSNVRRAPSSQSDKLGVLKRGSRVHVTGQVSGKPWYRIQTVEHGTGYVFAELLRKPAPAAKPAAPAAAAPARSPPAAPATTGFKTLRDCPACPELIVLPAGRFVMGDQRGDRSEKPAHNVSIERPFAIGKYEVTTAQWQACVDAGGCSHELDGRPAERTPVHDISWGDTQEYLRWLSQTTGEDYRLPSEAEWEYAARAGTRSRFWWGDAVGRGNANCKDCGDPWDNARPADIDAFAANPFGLYATSGGVWEWVADCWHRNYDGAPTDGSSWGKSDCREYVIRGGSWRNDATYADSASRFKYDAYVRYLLNGFRVAKSLP